MSTFNRLPSRRAMRAAVVAGVVALLALPGCNHRRQSMRPIIFGPSYSASTPCSSCGSAVTTGGSCSSCGGASSSSLGASSYSSSGGTSTIISPSGSSLSDDSAAAPDELAPVSPKSSGSGDKEPGLPLNGSGGKASFRSDQRTPTAFNNEGVEPRRGWSARRIAFP